MDKLFVDLVQAALLKKEHLPVIPDEKQWIGIFEEAIRQGVIGVLLDGLDRLPKEELPPQTVLVQWIGMMQMIETRNQLMNESCIKLQGLFENAGFKCCILKGQGNALLYPNPLRRQSGDIDIWVMPQESREKRRRVMQTISFLATVCGKEKLNVVYHHTEFPIWDDVEVEVHWRPSWRSSLFYNRRMQRWFLEKADQQFSNKDKQSGMIVPTWDFNVVYQLQHMFLHVLQEGIGLRQVIDYYYLLKTDYRIGYEDVSKTLRYLGLYEFAGAMMYVLKKTLAMDKKYLIVPVDEKRGRLLCSEILLSGNFGKYDERNADLQRKRGVRRSMAQLKRKWRFLRDYPMEVLSGPLQLYHVIWRKLKLWRWE